MIVLLLALFFEIISRNAARSVSVKSTTYLMQGRLMKFFTVMRD
jgi:hypothetical protein